jgi:hypothetical protein
MKLKLNITHNDLEVKQCDDGNLEIVKWIETSTRHCYTLAIFRPTKEGYELGFIGNRPFDDKVSTDFWTIAKMAQAILDLFWCDNNDD